MGPIGLRERTEWLLSMSGSLVISLKRLVSAPPMSSPVIIWVIRIVVR